MLKRAYSLLTVKEVDEGKRVIRGTASTPTVDRVGDVLEPLGARFATPMPLLLYHNSQKPVGTVDFAKPTKTGIPFVASLPDVVEPGVIQDRVNEAWHSLKYKLIAAVSVGFNAIDYEVMKNGGYLYKIWDWMELSLVTVPANPDAMIQSFKSMNPADIRAALSIDIAQRAASGNSQRSVTLIQTPGVSGTPAPRRGAVKLIPRKYHV